MSLLCLYLLGSPRIEIDGSPVNADTRKATALLAYIAATGESYRRDSLVNLLWPEYDQSRGRTNLRRTIYALRKALSGDWLDIDRENVGLKANANIYLDVDQFHYHLSTCLTHGHSPSQVCQSCLEPLATVVKLYRGDFMSGFSLKDSINFDEWQFLETNILRREFANALERYVECLSAKSDFDAATHYAKHWLTFDPLNEAAHCKLMQLYDWSGKRPEVYRQYQACVQVLKDEMGISPQPSTTTLYKNIVRGQGVDPPTFKGRGQASPGEVNDSESTLPIVTLISHSSTIQESSRSVFVAREREMEGLHNSLEAALEGKGRIVFITGAAGQGKSALLQEFARNAQNHYPDLLYASGNCNAQTGIGDPYLPFREILGLLTGDVDSLWAAGAISQEYARRIWDTFPLVTGTLVEVGPDLIETLIPGRPLARRAAAYVTGGINIQRAWLTQLEKIVSLREDNIHDPNLQQAALFEQFTQMMTSLSRERPLLLALDDLQWADIGSISLLFHIGRQLLGRRILILGAYRPEELAIGRGGERHPLEAVINEFQRAYGDITIDLTQADRQKFVESYLDSEPNRFSTNFRKTLYHQTKGHPLFTVELLRGMQERGNLVQDLQGCWVEGEMLDWDILPTRIEAVIAERIGRLDPESQEILRIASVEGEVFTAEVVARVLSLDEQNMIRRLSDRLERIHHLVRAQEIQRLGTRRLSRYRFRHILFQNYLYHCLDPVERTYLHEVIGTALENIHEGETQEIAVSLARHFQEAGIETVVLKGAAQVLRYYGN
ncbi:MAG: AAA family ATPase, partial [Candidatus Thorarchaeota archaeon]